MVTPSLTLSPYLWNIGLSIQIENMILDHESTDVTLFSTEKSIGILAQCEKSDLFLTTLYMYRVWLVNRPWQF